MNPAYAINDISDLYSPGLLFYKDLIRQNIARTIEIAGDAGRLRPHVKTHKTREIVRMAMDAGILKHKCATLAEAEMLAACGVTDVLLAYNLVGPNCGRMARLARAYPACRFAVTADHAAAAETLSKALAAEGRSVDVLLDLDVGQHRTGVRPVPKPSPSTIPSPIFLACGPAGCTSTTATTSRRALMNAKPLLCEHSSPCWRCVKCWRSRACRSLASSSAVRRLFRSMPNLICRGWSCRPAPASCTITVTARIRRSSRLHARRSAADARRQPSDRHAPHLRPRHEGRRQRSARRQSMRLVRCARLRSSAAKRGAFRRRDACRRPFQSRRRDFRHTDSHLSDMRLHQRAYVIENGRCTEMWAIAARDRVLTI